VRGDVYRLRKGKGAEAAAGHEQDGQRYAVIVQSSDAVLSTWIVCPTSTSCAAASFRPLVLIEGGETRVMVDQIAAIDPEKRLGDRVDFLSLGAMQQIDQALLMLLSLDH
jgi:mRNA interferase MazF